MIYFGKLQKNQSSLFEGDAENGSSENTLNSLINNDEVTPWNKKETLQYEKEVLGFYVTAHPLEEHASILDMEASVNLSTIYEMGDKTSVTFGGITNNIKTIKTRKNDTMGYLTVEDLHGSVEVIVFPEIYQSSQLLLESGEPLFVRGHLDISEDDENKKVKVVAKEIVPLSSMVRAYESLVIKVKREMSVEKVGKISEILNRYPGNKQGYINVITDDTELFVDLGQCIDITPALKKELQQLLGADSTHIS